jgi:hypothetical protein
MLNKIGIAERTWGTETSKYPEEEKETSIPPVAASEEGRAQTKSICFWGWGLSLKGRAKLVEASWKAPPKEVTVL